MSKNKIKSLTPKLKAKIRKQIKDKEVLCFNESRVRIVEILDSGLVKVKRMRMTRGCFGLLSIDPNRLETIIPNPYSHKNPMTFLKRNGFEGKNYCDGTTIVEKKVEGLRVIIWYRNPCTKESSRITLGAEYRDGSILCWASNKTDFNEVLSLIPSLIKEINGKHKKRKKKIQLAPQTTKLANKRKK